MFDEAFAPFEYKEKIRTSILAFKYSGRAEYAQFYAAAIWAYGKEKIRAWEPDLILPVPVHPSRERKRGYNQAALIARELSAYSRIPVCESLVRRVKKTVPQNELSLQDRKKNLENAFALSADQPVPKRILIVDDILTSGSTADSLALKLKTAGAEKVFLCTISVET